MKNKINILETTLRDGSYAIDFSFTAQDTSNICRKLEDAGFEYIEVGHGVGLNASNCGYGKAVASDEEYLAAASSALNKSKFGMFCIPGIARLQDLDLAAKYKMGFVRIGTNVTEVDNAKDFIERAKKHGMFVASNFMKSYAMSPKDFARKVKLAESFGADMIYLVDSAGGMFLKDIEDYFYAVREVSDISLGFHGHDNLCLAVANSLKATELGFDFIDSSLQGLGRSAGNAVTEVLVAALSKLGYQTNVDLLKVLDVGKECIFPLIKKTGRTILDTVSGYSEFHSSYTKVLERSALRYGVSPVALMIEVSKVEKVNLSEQLLDTVADKIRKENYKELY